MDKIDHQAVLRAEADDLDRTAGEYERLVVTRDGSRETAILVLRAVAAAKRAAAAVLA